jgi:hypothetical protein
VILKLWKEPVSPFFGSWRAQSYYVSRTQRQEAIDESVVVPKQNKQEAKTDKEANHLLHFLHSLHFLLLLLWLP